MQKKHNQEILAYLSEKTGKPLKTIRNQISLIRQKYASATLNAAAQLFAQANDTSVLKWLDEADRTSLPQQSHQVVLIKGNGKQRNNHLKKIAPLFEYATNDYFKKAHIEELFKAYANRCYTSVFILFRKIIENLIIDILRTKYPGSKQENKGLYYNIVQKRYHDFSIILDSLKSKKGDFGIDGEKIITRLIQLTSAFKNDANDKTHSWYHIVESKDEADGISFTIIIELLKNLEIDGYISL